MTDALNVLKQIRNAEQKDKILDPEDWLTWLLNGSWRSLLIKGLVGIASLLLLMCVFTTCVIPCFKKMVSNMIAHSVNAYVAVHNPAAYDSDQNPDSEEDDDYV